MSTPGTPTSMTIVAEGTRFEGTLSGGAGITIDGVVEGKVAVSGTLNVSRSGRVKAEIRARTVTISGTVTGDVAADEKIRLEDSAVVKGDLCSPRILIVDGASLQGNVEMNKPSTDAPKTEAAVEKAAPVEDKAGHKGKGKKKGPAAT